MAEIILKAENVGMRFGNFTALSGVTAEFERGRLTAIIGPNGAGKSTFFNCLSGAFPPTTGTIEFKGQRIEGAPQERFAHMGIAKSFQITNVFPQLTAHENVRVSLQAKRVRYDLWRNRAHYAELDAQAAVLLSQVGLGTRAQSRADDLAHGQQRALEIAMALAAAPELLLMDEPTAGMSPEETRTMMDLITKLAAERTVILVEHKMKLVMGLAERVVVLHQGATLAVGTPAEIRANDEVKRVYLGQHA